jgi:hypothetical protein
MTISTETQEMTRRGKMEITENILYMVINQWDKKSPAGSLAEATMATAYFLWKRHSLQPSGVIATMKDRLPLISPLLAEAYQQFIDEVEAWASQETGNHPY